MNDTTCRIPLTQSQFATVSPEDYEFLMQFKWCAEKTDGLCGRKWYAIRRLTKQRKNIRMHRVVGERMGLSMSSDIDHANRNGLDCRRENLRSCNQMQNNANAGKRAGTSSQYKGVSWDKTLKKWHAYIKINGKRMSLGYYVSELEAAAIYIAFAIYFWGDFARFA